ncbi:aldo/keto reductase [Micromonospora sp. NPDC007271]|uniref:aldo/keto reductase n=1 Tax=Micromonospora sp. NPDC007271 TaxID=3154587 RepID=UPI0033D28BC9
MSPPEPAPWAARVVLGTWGISGSVGTDTGPAGYPDVPAAEVDAVLDTAYAAGVRWIDTAPAYGGGAGMRRVADWQRRRVLRWHVVVKPGRPPGPAGPRSEIDLASIRAELARQPLLEPAAVLVKDPPAAAFRDGTLLRLIGQLYADGHPVVGLATHRLDLIAQLGPPPVPDAVVQLEYHLLNRMVAGPAARSAAAAGWRVWGMQPLAYGFLGGRHHAGTTFGPDDWRSRMPIAVRRAFDAGVRGLRSWLPACAVDRPPAEVALAWCLAAPALDRVVVGPRRVAHLDTLDGAWWLATDPEFVDFVTAFGNPVAGPAAG